MVATNPKAPPPPNRHRKEADPVSQGEKMETETIDRLFLELSQVTQATTAKEIALQEKVRWLHILLARYRDEVPLEHQPHKIAHIVDAELGRA